MSNDSTWKYAATIREATETVLDIIERDTPPDAEVRLFLAREVSRLLNSGLLARLQKS